MRSGEGVRLKDVLAKAGCARTRSRLVVNGADGPVLDKTPDFVKSIPAWKGARREHDHRPSDERRSRCRTTTAFRSRLIVPGWTATYWMKHLVTIEAGPSRSTVSG